MRPRAARVRSPWHETGTAPIAADSAAHPRRAKTLTSPPPSTTTAPTTLCASSPSGSGRSTPAPRGPICLICRVAHTVSSTSQGTESYRTSRPHHRRTRRLPPRRLHRTRTRTQLPPKTALAKRSLPMMAPASPLLPPLPPRPPVPLARPRGPACHSSGPGNGTVRVVRCLPCDFGRLTGLALVASTAAALTGCGSGDSTVAKTPLATTTSATPSITARQ